MCTFGLNKLFLKPKCCLLLIMFCLSVVLKGFTSKFYSNLRVPFLVSGKPLSGGGDSVGRV